jgi:hypothetical protein
VALVGGSGGSFYGVSLKQLCCLFASFVMNTGMRCLSFMSLIFFNMYIRFPFVFLS